MPIHTGQDKNGKFYQWGKTGKKYYFKPEDKQSKQRALNKAKKQQTAIYSSGWKGDTMKLIKVKKGDAVQGQMSAKEIEQSRARLVEKLKELDTLLSVAVRNVENHKAAAEVFDNPRAIHKRLTITRDSVEKTIGALEHVKK